MKAFFILLATIASCTTKPKAVKQPEPTLSIKVQDTTVLIKPTPPVEYHIKVTAYVGGMYQIKFTNDNWVTECPIIEALDMTNIGEVWKTTLTTDCERATEIARSLPTYESAVAYNHRVDAQYDRLVAFRKANPIPVIAVEEKCAAETIIY